MNHTLLSKREWCEKAPNSYIKGTSETWKQKANRELLSLLCRTPFESNEAAERGILFENQVYGAASMPEDEVTGSDHFKEVVNTVRGAKFQTFHTKDMELNDCIIRWYGILDAEFKNKIIDIKTTAKLKVEKYKTSPQADIYKWLTNKDQFTYVIAEWDKFPKINRIMHIDSPSMFSSLCNVLKQEAIEFIEWLRVLGYFELYRDCYCHLGQGWKSEIAKKGPKQQEQLAAFYAPYQHKYLSQFQEDSEGF